MVDAVIFDMDGLMLDTQRVWDETILANAARHGNVLPDGFLDQIRGSSGDVVFAIVTEWLGSEAEAMFYIREIWTEAEEAFERGVYKKPGLDELLGWLKEHKVPMAVASGSKMKWIDHHLQLAEVYDYFDAFAADEEVEHAKPAPDLFLLAAERLGVNPANTIVLEDSNNGILAAHAGGFIPVMVPDIDTPIDEIRSLCLAVCDTLSDAIPLLERELA